MAVNDEIKQKTQFRLSAKLPGNNTPWIKQLREQALTHFLQNGFPTTRDEEWRYTPLRQLKEVVFANNVTHSSYLTETSEILLQQASYQNRLENLIELVLINGEHAGLNHPVDYIASLAYTMDHDPESLNMFLNKTTDLKIPTNAFTTLNTALMQNGVVINVPENQTVTIHLIFLTATQKEPLACYLRNLIILNKNAQATVIETYLGDDEHTYLTNTVTEIALSENALLTHYKLQQEGKKAFHFGTTYVKQAHPNSQFSGHMISLGGLLSRSDTHTLLDALHTSCLLNGLYYLSENQHMDHYTSMDHRKPQGVSREFYKGILDDQSRGVFNGKVFVRQDAQKTDSQQYNQNLLLSADAEIDTKPQLEIFADDVKCVHGATVGQLDEEALFYLRSRGLPLETARHILTDAFFNDVLERMPHPILREHIKQCL